MRKLTVVIDAAAIAGGTAVIYAAFSLSRGVSDTGAPMAAAQVFGSPEFIVPAAITIACVVALVAVLAVREKVAGATPMQSATNDQPTGFRVGKKTIGSTRVADDVGGGDPTGFRVGKKTTSGTRVSGSPGTGNEDLTGFRVGKKSTSGTRVDSAPGAGAEPLREQGEARNATGNEELTGFRVGRKTTGST